jgi:predicted transglutaminase-like cysteine proteinase
MMREILATIIFLAALNTGNAGVPPDPFGGNTEVVFYGNLVTGWREVRDELIGDHAMLGACVDSTSAPCAQARTLWQIINDAKQQDGLARIGHINRAINMSIVPFEPSQWLTALEAIKGAGDCQAYATAKYFALREAGIAADRVRLVIVHERGYAENHMVTAVWYPGRWLILDNRTLTLSMDTESKYMPVFVLDDDGLRRYQHRQIR